MPVPHTSFDISVVVQFEVFGNTRSLTPTRAPVKTHARSTGFGMTICDVCKLYRYPAAGAVQTALLPDPAISNLCLVDSGKFFVDAAAGAGDSPRQLVKAAFRVAAGNPPMSFAGSPLVASHQVSRHQHVSRRVILPVIEQLIYLPQGEPADLAEAPSGSSSDVTIEERPIGYTGTGVGSPADALFRPETSSMALNRVLKSSKVRPLSSCSAVRS